MQRSSASMRVIDGAKSRSHPRRSPRQVLPRRLATHGVRRLLLPSRTASEAISTELRGVAHCSCGLRETRAVHDGAYCGRTGGTLRNVRNATLRRRDCRGSSHHCHRELRLSTSIPGSPRCAPGLISLGDLGEWGSADPRRRVPSGTSLPHCHGIDRHRGMVSSLTRLAASIDSSGA
jgi:hypothetical protein